MEALQGTAKQAQKTKQARKPGVTVVLAAAVITVLALTAAAVIPGLAALLGPSFRTGMATVAAAEAPEAPAYTPGQTVIFSTDNYELYAVWDYNDGGTARRVVSARAKAGSIPGGWASIIAGSLTARVTGLFMEAFLSGQSVYYQESQSTRDLYVGAPSLDFPNGYVSLGYLNDTSQIGEVVHRRIC